MNPATYRLYFRDSSKLGTDRREYLYHGGDDIHMVTDRDQCLLGAAPQESFSKHIAMGMITKDFLAGHSEIKSLESCSAR